MKPSKACFGAFLTIVPLLFCTCRKPEFTEPVPLAPTAAEVQTAVERTELSADDAAKVAIRYCNADAATRTDAAPTVRNVLTIRDAAGRPALYAVNMQEGYLLVSATKCCYPVLAQIDRGTFALDREPSGLDVILQELIETVEAARDSLVVFDCRPTWRPYEERIGPERIRTRMNDDELYDIQNEWYQKWYDEGADVHRLTPKPDDMPEDLYRRFCETAEGDDAWVDTEYNYLNTAVITTKYNSSSSKKGPFLTTKWGQKNGYNALFENKNQPLGCVTVAVGQLMRYYRHPASFDWSNMPDETSNTTLASFLTRLHGELRVNDDGSSNIDHAKRVLESYGYSCSKRGHDASTVYTMLNSNLPVYTRGEDKARNKGHAWVIDGSNSITAYTEYKLYALNNGLPRPWYVELDSERVYHTQNVFFHMNWGQYGLYNGWFLDTRISFKNDNNEICNYSSDRKDLLITDF